MKNEERIKKVTRTSTLIMGFVISVYGYIMYFASSINDKWIRLGIVTIFILLTFAVMYFRRDKIFNKVLKLFWIPNSKDKKILGNWDICIFFQNNEQFDRIGTLKFEDSYEGLYIKGDKLTDNKGKQTVEEWFSQEAEIHHLPENKILLVYLYWVNDNGIANDYRKLGIVTATSSDGGKSFEGTFKDFALVDGEITREGKVRLNKCETLTINQI